MNVLRRLVGAMSLQSVPPQTVAGLRVALSLTVPFAIGVAVDEVARGGLVANGAFLVALCNVGGAYATRARVTAIALIAIPLTTFVAVLAANAVWVAAAVGAVWMVAWSLTSLWGSRFAFLGLTASVAYVVYLHAPGDWPDAVEVLWLSALGGVWAFVLSLALWPWLAGRPGRMAAAAAFRATGDIARALGDDVGDGDDRSARVAEARTRSLDLVPEVLGDIDASPRRDREELLSLFEHAHAVGQQVLLRAGENDGSLSTAVADHTTDGCERIAAGLDGDLRWWQWRGLRPGHAALPASVAAADDLLRGLGGRLPSNPELRGRYRTGRAVRSPLIPRLRAILSFDSLLFRHAVRLAVAVFAAILLFGLADLRNGYWIPLTVILVLKADIGATLDRAVQRSLGTIAGAVLGAVIVVTVDSDAVLAVVLFPLAWFLVAMVPLNYFFWALAITPLVVVVRDTGDLGDWWLAVSRVANSLVGVALALVASFVLWPSWTRLRLPAAVDSLMRAFEAWTGAVLEALAGRRADREQLGLDPHAPHMRVLRERTNVVISVDQLDRELPRRAAHIEAARDFELTAMSYTDAVAALARRAESGTAELPAPTIDELQDAVVAAFHPASAERTVTATPTGDAGIDRVREQLDHLVAARARLTAAQPDG